MNRGEGPRYPLRDVKRAVGTGRHAITRSAAQGAAGLYLDEEDIRRCVLGVEGGDFFKIMASVQRPGMSQDVYKCRYGGFSIYLKLQMSREGWAVIASFKQDENP
jgi:hypothetical protein